MTDISFLRNVVTSNLDDIARLFGTDGNLEQARAKMLFLLGMLVSLTSQTSLMAYVAELDSYDEQELHGLYSFLDTQFQAVL